MSVVFPLGDESFEEREQRWLSLRESIQAGLDDIERGDVAPLDVEDIKQRGRQRLTERNGEQVCLPACLK